MKKQKNSFSLWLKKESPVYMFVAAQIILLTIFCIIRHIIDLSLPVNLLVTPSIITGYNAFSTLLLGAGFYYDKFYLIVVSFVPILLKLTSAIFIFKKKKIFYLVFSILCFIDFICMLVYISNLQLTGKILEEFSFYNKFCIVGGSLFPLIYSAIILSIYFKEKSKTCNLQKHKRNVLLGVYLSTFLILFVGVFACNYTDKNFATDEEIELLNKCYNYSEQYLYSTLPTDKQELEVMQKDIEAVLDGDVFKRTVSKSNYKQRFLKVQNDNEEGFYSTTTEKSEYANELIFLKCKILLALDKNDEFIRYYQENQYYFGCWTDLFHYYLENNVDNFSDDDIEAIDKCMKTVLKSDENNVIKFFAHANLIKIYKDCENYETEIKPQLKDLEKTYMKNFTADDYVDYTDDASVVKECLYILK